MIQLLRHETITKFFSSLLILFLTALPITTDLVAAQSLDSGDIPISYFPARVGRYGQQVTIRAHIPEDVAVEKVTLIIADGDKPLRGAMPRVQQDGIVPVIVKAMRQAPIRTGAAVNKSIKASLQPGETMHIAGEKNGYYRGIAASGEKGYVYKNDVNITRRGHAYAVTLPASMTQRSKLTYFIEATDTNGHTSRTEPVTMRLLTNEEIDMFMAMYGGGASPATAPLYKKPLFWASVAALAGGAYLLSSDSNDGENQTPVNVLVEWE